MEETLQTTKTVYTISQFLDWQLQGTLDLSPIFQRRPVWKGPAKSLLVDSIVKGYPVPIILLRQVQDLENYSMKMEVVDGQQRLRTLLSFIRPTCISDFDDAADRFTVRKIHSAELANKPFAQLPSRVKQKLLGYELSTHVFPASTGDELVFRIFARLNSTGLSLKDQEVRNAEFHGAFKSLVYELSFENFDNWRSWSIFSNSAIARMDEAEAVSEYILAFFNGIEGKSKDRISNFYRQNEEEFPQMRQVGVRFRAVMKTIDEYFGKELAESAFSRPALFYSLVTAIYDHMYGLRSPWKAIKPATLPKGIKLAFNRASEQIRAKNLPDSVQDAMDKATSDKARRLLRHKFLVGAMKLEPAS